MSIDNIENKTTETILQLEIDVVIGTKSYHVAPPSTATLMLVSAKIAELPAIELNSTNIASECLSVAKDCGAIGDIVAIMILGAKKVTKRGLFGLFARGRNQRKLAKKILANLTPKELSELLSKLLVGLELSFFFGITTSLLGINLLRQTKTTAPGQ